MEVNLNVKVKAGKRTQPSVLVACFGVNVKTIEFANGKTITDEELANWIAENLQSALVKFAKEG